MTTQSSNNEENKETLSQSFQPEKIQVPRIDKEQENQEMIQLQVSDGEVGTLTVDENDQEEDDQVVVGPKNYRIAIHTQKQPQRGSKAGERGRWTTYEHENFIKGIQKWGQNWKMIQTDLKTRTSTQIRSHAQKFFKQIKKKGQTQVIDNIKHGKSLDSFEKNVLQQAMKTKKTEMTFFSCQSCVNSQNNEQDEEPKKIEEKQQVINPFTGLSAPVVKPIDIEMMKAQIPVIIKETLPKLQKPATQVPKKKKSKVIKKNYKIIPFLGSELKRKQDTQLSYDILNRLNILQTKKQNLQMFILSELPNFQVQLNLVSEFVFSNEYATDLNFNMFTSFFEQLFESPEIQESSELDPDVQVEKLQEYFEPFFDQLQNMSDDLGSLILKAEDKKTLSLSVLPQQRNVFKQLNLFHLEVLIQKLFIERLQNKISKDDNFQLAMIINDPTQQELVDHQ